MELETHPYIIMKSTCPVLASVNVEDQSGSLYDHQFEVKYVSKSFRTDYLLNVLLTSQGAVDFDANDPSNTRKLGREELRVEDLIFRRIRPSDLSNLDSSFMSD